MRLGEREGEEVCWDKDVHTSVHQTVLSVSAI